MAQVMVSKKKKQHSQEFKVAAFKTFQGTPFKGHIFFKETFFLVTGHYGGFTRVTKAARFLPCGVNRPSKWQFASD